MADQRVRGSTIKGVMGVGFALLGSPVLAQDWPGWGSDHFDVGSYETGCAIQSTFDREGRSSIKFNVLYDGERPMLWIASMDWSAVPSQEYRDLHFAFDEEIFSGGTSVGQTFDHIYKGFITPFPPEFLDHLAADDRLMVFRATEEAEEPMLVADFGLAGSGAAVAALRRCTAWVLNRNAERERRERANDYIERDPFASGNRSLGEASTPAEIDEINKRLEAFEAPSSSEPHD